MTRRGQLNDVRETLVDETTVDSRSSGPKPGERDASQIRDIVDTV
jgi:hypothetical protein